MSTREQQETLKQRKAFLQNTLHNIEWAFQLLAIYTIPILFISSVILGMQVSGYIDKAGTVGGPICWLAGAALMTAIELSMLGSFGLAATEMKNGQKWRGALLFIMGIAFIVITIVTLSMAKNGAEGDAANTISTVRLSAAVLYAVLAHGVTTSTDGEDLVVTPDLYEELVNQIQGVQSEIPQVVQSQVQGVVQSLVPGIVQGVVQQVVQGVVQQVVQEVVQSQSQIIVSEMQSLVQEVVQSQLENVQSQFKHVVNAIPGAVQDLVSEQVQPLVQVVEEGNNTNALQELAERIQEVSTTVSEMRTTITEVRTVRQITESRPKVARSRVVETEPPLKLVQSGSSGGSSKTKREPVSELANKPASEPPSEPASEPVDVRVQRFILEQIEQGIKPSLSQIMNQCKCSKNTAIRYRRELLDNQEEASSPEPDEVHTDPDLVAIGD